MNRIPIKHGQIWQHKRSGKRCIIFGKDGGNWRTRTIEEDYRKVQNHSLANNTLWSKFILIK